MLTASSMAIAPPCPISTTKKRKINQHVKGSGFESRYLTSRCRSILHGWNGCAASPNSAAFDPSGKGIHVVQIPHFETLIGALDDVLYAGSKLREALQDRFFVADCLPSYTSTCQLKNEKRHAARKKFAALTVSLSIQFYASLFGWHEGAKIHYRIVRAQIGD